MSRHSFSPGDAAAIAAGGVVGAVLRHVVAARESIDSVLVWDPPELADTGNLVPGMDGGNLLIFIYEFPAGTVIVNLVGCLLLGGLTVISPLAVTVARRRWLTGATLGFCGSLTTFSTFAVDAAKLLRGRPTLVERYPDESMHFDPAVGDAALYLGLSVIGGGLALWVGRLLGARLLSSLGETTPGNTP